MDKISKLVITMGVLIVSLMILAGIMYGIVQVVIMTIAIWLSVMTGIILGEDGFL